MKDNETYITITDKRYEELLAYEAVCSGSSDALMKVVFISDYGHSVVMQIFTKDEAISMLAQKVKHFSEMISKLEKQIEDRKWWEAWK